MISQREHHIFPATSIMLRGVGKGHPMGGLGIEIPHSSAVCIVLDMKPAVAVPRHNPNRLNGPAPTAFSGRVVTPHEEGAFRCGLNRPPAPCVQISVC